ncbi:MAG: hypothetical protein KAQ99_01145 [Candidatus Aureabacteria bacterium]|nr:hypothetical protein [Candidatus Auribacterota bacterium]MCK5160154.1 hypothetical protein [Candidatus Auribacterota bacterium]
MMMIQTWQKKYHPLYNTLKYSFDKYVIEFIAKKEGYIASAPLSHSLLKHDFPGIRRYKSGKFRILFALSIEASRYWPSLPENPEILFLYVDLRKDDTYKEALKLLRKHALL